MLDEYLSFLHEQSIQMSSGENQKVRSLCQKRNAVLNEMHKIEPKFSKMWHRTHGGDCVPHTKSEECEKIYKETMKIAPWWSRKREEIGRYDLGMQRILEKYTHDYMKAMSALRSICPYPKWVATTKMSI